MIADPHIQNNLKHWLAFLLLLTLLNLALCLFHIMNQLHITSLEMNRHCTMIDSGFKVDFIIW